MTQLKDKNVAAGSTAMFELKIMGKPFPEVSWMHNNVQLSQGGRVQMSSSESPTGGEIWLRISPVLDTDAGSYACILNSPAGQSRANTCQLRVQRQSLLFSLHFPVSVTQHVLGFACSQG